MLSSLEDDSEFAELNDGVRDNELDRDGPGKSNRKREGGRTALL